MSVLLSSPPAKLLVNQVYEARRDRLVNPEGTFDSGSRWYPSDREDCGGSGSSTRGPARAWPYSYMVRCRTKQHVANLVAAWLDGDSVPDDVTAAVRSRFAGRTDDEVRGVVRLESVGVKPAGVPTEFVTSVGGNVADEAPVLVLADWLEENGRGREAAKARAKVAAQRPAEELVAVG